MEIAARMSNKVSCFWASLLNTLRRFSAKHELIGSIRTLRLIIHFGPWRAIPRFLVRQLRPARLAQDAAQKSLLEIVDAEAIAKEVSVNSVAVVGRLPTEFINRIRKVTDHLPVEHYQLMHHIDKDVCRLSNDPAVKSVLRTYFGSEPALLESTLVVTDDSQLKFRSEQNSFHFDFAGWESLNVFVYLSDVVGGSSCHSIAMGSHLKIEFRDLIRPSISDDEAVERFGDSMRDIVGPAGTLFFENTEAFHRRYPGKNRRVMLNLLYASHRSWLSHGRSSRKHIEKRAIAYRELGRRVAD